MPKKIKIGERTDAEGSTYEVFSDGSTRLIAYRDDEGNMHYRDETWLEDVEVVGERPKKWWQQYDPAKAEEARQNWNQYMAPNFTDYSNPYLFRQLGNTSSNSTTPKALQTEVLGGNEPWQQQIYKPSAYDRYDYRRDIDVKFQMWENEQKAEERRQNLLGVFLTSNPQYKIYTPRTGIINKIVPYTGKRNLQLSEEERQELRNEMLFQLSEYHLDKVYQSKPMNILDFFNDNFDRIESEIITQRKDGSKTFLSSQKGGPRVRYIQDPINPTAAIDLRHMLIIGKQGEIVGNSVELGQSSVGMSSGANYQDYYSNYLGYQFYKVYGNNLKQNPKKFAQYLYDFLTSNQYGRLDTNGDINYYE